MSDGPSERAQLTVMPVGVVRSPFVERVEAPRQPVAAEQTRAEVHIFDQPGFADALCDLASWDHLWLVVWFHQNEGFRPKVLPPRSSVKRGVFATRAPYRPNPIGLSLVRLLGVSGLTLQVQGIDLLDGTPVLDVKPYVPYTDCIPEANHGWLDAEARARDGDRRPADPLADYAVTFSPHAALQLAYLEELGDLELRGRIEAALRLGPQPHAYRRIREDAEGRRLAVKDFRVRFVVDGRTMHVTAIRSGYRPKQLLSEAGAPELHRLFVARFPGEYEK